MIPELDFFTPAWMGSSDTFDQKFVCDEAKEGAVFGKQVPVIVAYVSAFYIKRHHGGLCDCNVAQCGQINGKPNDLCHFGAVHQARLGGHHQRVQVTRRVTRAVTAPRGR